MYYRLLLTLALKKGKAMPVVSQYIPFVKFIQNSNCAFCVYEINVQPASCLLLQSQLQLARQFL
jgi:hypothetical protein